MLKQYLALARVSSREQEREGFSLEIQEDALKRYAEQHGGEIEKLFRIAETATKPDERYRLGGDYTPKSHGRQLGFGKDTSAARAQKFLGIGIPASAAYSASWNIGRAAVAAA